MVGGGKMHSKYMSKPQKKQIFIQEISSNEKLYKKSYNRMFIVSLNGKDFYKVRALNPRQALNIVMSIGQNPLPTTTPPPAPGKQNTISSQLFWSATPISKKTVIQLLRSEPTREKVNEIKLQIYPMKGVRHKFAKKRASVRKKIK